MLPDQSIRNHGPVQLKKKQILTFYESFLYHENVSDELRTVVSYEMNLCEILLPEAFF